MRLESSVFSDQILKKISLPYGDFYFLDNIVVSEIHEGQTFTYEKAKPVIEAAMNFYGRNAKVGYLANRINTYALVPHDWLKVFKEHYNIPAMAFVAYTPMGLTNILLEKMFIKGKVSRFNSLEFAVHWMQAQLAPQAVLATA